MHFSTRQCFPICRSVKEKKKNLIKWTLYLCHYPNFCNLQCSILWFANMPSFCALTYVQIWEDEHFYNIVERRAYKSERNTDPQVQKCLGCCLSQKKIPDITNWQITLAEDAPEIITISFWSQLCSQQSMAGSVECDRKNKWKSTVLGWFR